MADAQVRIMQLRNWMRAHDIDAYLVPHSDAFQSEYLAPSTERLAWLTAFTGSHGMAAILDKKAVLFTNGIYTLQASLQIDASLYEIIESPPANPMEWLAQHAPENAVIGFDPSLFTAGQIAVWYKASLKHHWTFLPINDNPIDTFWQDKPFDDVIAAEIHPIEFSGVTTETKVAQIIEQINPRAHHILISDPSLVCWLLNMRGKDIAHTPLVHSVSLLDKEGQVTLFTNPKKITTELRNIWGNHVSVEDLSDLQNVILKINKPLQIDPTQANFSIKNFCDENNIAVIEAADPSLLLRATKNETEISGSFAAHKTDAKAFDLFFDWFRARDFDKETITELDVIDKLHECRMATNECTDESFDTIAGYGSNGAIIHYRADEQSNLQLKNGSLLLLDSGGQYRNGTTDITRVLAVGTPTTEMKTHYTAVLKGLIDLSMTRFTVGTMGIHLDAIARAPIWAIGLNYAHGTGHGVGSYLSVHEGPQRINTNNMVPLKPSMILSIEPGIYLEGHYGIRLENLVVVVEDKREGDVEAMLAFKTLTCVPFEEALIDQTMLTPEEKAFLSTFKR